MEENSRAEPYDFTLFVRWFELRTLIDDTARAVNADADARRLVLDGIARADAKRRPGASAFVTVHPAGFGPIACVANRFGKKFAAPLEPFVNYVIDERLKAGAAGR